MHIFMYIHVYMKGMRANGRRRQRACRCWQTRSARWRRFSWLKRGCSRCCPTSSRSRKHQTPPFLADEISTSTLSHRQNQNKKPFRMGDAPNPTLSRRGNTKARPFTPMKHQPPPLRVS